MTTGRETNPEPSPQARRAAEAVRSEIWRTINSVDKPSVGELAEIVERETGVGAALDFIRRLAEDENDALSMEYESVVTNYSAEARAFLARKNPR
jgi:hypothetical protein